MNADRLIGHGEIGIQFDSPLAVGLGLSGAVLAGRFLRECVGLQRFEGRCGGLFQGNVEALHGTQRFAQLTAEFGSRRAQRVQHLVLGRRTYLLPGQRISALAVHCLELQNVFTSQASDRFRNVGFAAGPEAKIARDSGRQPRAGRLSHQFQRAGNLILGKNIEEGRLPQGDTERGFQRVVEDGLTCGVGEIGQNDGVFFLQLEFFMAD